MTCYFPLRAWRSRNVEDTRMTFDRTKGLPNTETLIPCGRCIGCRLAHARMWAIRCVHESKLHERNCFITLTYDDKYLPLVKDLPDVTYSDSISPSFKELPTLNKRHFVLFMKRLRKKYGKGIRFFQCGEYGEKLHRPHHHAIIFGFDFPDKQIFSRKFGVDLFTSMDLQKLWGMGFCTIGSVTFDSACYTARYIMKKQTGDVADVYYRGREREYTTMSRRPGIGRDYYEKYKEDFYNYDRCVVLGDYVLKPPKYYDSLFDLDDHERLKELKDIRKKQSPNLDPALDFERLEIMAKSTHLKMNRFSRDYQK